jgi:dihydroorotase
VIPGRTDQPELVVRHAHVLDPGTGLDGVFDVRISDGRIAEVGENLRGRGRLDADGLHLFPWVRGRPRPLAHAGPGGRGDHRERVRLGGGRRLSPASS